ncbi:MAG: AraC family ligand binding domain-containing protein, partial [Clostridia bacterium]|nr:AraC family ligand binding domain-containing protein [Clostridia bacterium]
MNAVSPVDERIRAMLPLYLLNVGADHKQEPRNRPNGAGFYQFLYIARGEGVVESGTLSLTVKEGTTVFSTKDVPIAYRAKAGEFRTGWVAFDGARVREILDYLGAEDIAFLHSDAVRAQMLEIYKRTARNASAEILSCNVYELIVTFFGELN